MHALSAIVWFWSSPDRTVARLSLALLLGMLIGAERQWRQRSAGLRTNTLVCLGAAAFVELSSVLTHNNSSEVSRIIGYIVSGVGFLGAGAIMKEGATIRGLNTAATLWCSAAIGATAAAGEPRIAFFLCAVVISVNFLLRPVTIYIDRLSGSGSADIQVAYVMRVACNERDEAHMRALLMQGLADAGLALQELESANAGQAGIVQITAQVLATARNDSALERLCGRLSLESAVSGVHWRVAVPTET
jgi:putative Mg2+ transporter-C (MgtC) family protein